MTSCSPISWPARSAAWPRDLARHLAPGGTAILAGLLDWQARWVLAAHRRQGLVLERVLRRGRLAHADAAAARMTLEAIHHWWRLDDRVTTSGQPSEAELAELAADGVRRVINLAPHSHARALPDEAGSVERLGMRYVHIPVDFQAPAQADFDAFCAAMAGEDRVHVHCAANYRVSAFLFRYRRDVLGVDAARARADLQEVWQPDAVWERFIAS